MPDKQGMVCAVDMGFMSTSRNRMTPIEYMASDGADNVLWCLHPDMESDSAYHRGADISRLSQFAGEEEGEPHPRGCDSPCPLVVASRAVLLLCSWVRPMFRQCCSRHVP